MFTMNEWVYKRVGKKNHEFHLKTKDVDYFRFYLTHHSSLDLLPFVLSTKKKKKKQGIGKNFLK